MRQPIHTPGSMAVVRDLAKRFEAEAIEQCLDLAISDRANTCYVSSKAEDAINVLARAGFVRKQMQLGVPLVVAMRELGKRIRSIQGH